MELTREIFVQDWQKARDALKFRIKIVCVEGCAFRYFQGLLFHYVINQEFPFLK